MQQLTYDGAAVHRETPDGRWLYYVRHEEPGLWRVSSQGGKEEVVLDRVKSELYRAWAVGRHGIYYTYQDETTKKWIIALYDPERGTERPLATVDRALPRWSGTLSVSPDERWMVVPLIEAEGSRLVLFSGVPRPRSRNDGSFSL